ncbi:MAG: caspase family protein [Bacteroidota bacterium]
MGSPLSGKYDTFNMSSRRLFALLVGIDKYQNPIPPLDGCVNDMRAMHDYLERYTQQKGIDYFPVILENEAATRFNIVGKFESHLTQAGEDDVAVFYYSGHGSQEEAHELFWEIESDHKNETLVCYDSRLPDGMDLADKELATLIDLVAVNDPHIVVIVDACNSGDGTRHVGAQMKVRQVEQVPRLMNGQPRVRMPQSYILPRQVETERALRDDSQAEDFIIPYPKHISLAASRSFELAKETYLGGSPRGVFTYSLIEVLETTVGSLSYNDLMRRVRSLVAQRTYDQMPQISANPAENVNLEFLEGLTTLSSNYFSLNYEGADGWAVDGGGIHGIVPPNFTGQTTILSVFSFDSTEADLQDPSKAIGKATVTSVLSGKSMVELQDGLLLDQHQAYKCKIFEIPVEPLMVYAEAREKLVKKIYEAGKAMLTANSYLAFVDRQMLSDYTIYHQHGQFILTRSADGPEMPLASPTESDDDEDIDKVLRMLMHIANYERIKSLKNPGSSLASEAIKIDLIDPDSGEIFEPDSDGFTFSQDGGPGTMSSFKIRVRNDSNDDLFCSLAFFDSQFSIQTGLLGPNGKLLEPGEEAYAMGGAKASGHVPDFLFAQGITQVEECLKVFFATRDVNPTSMRMPSLGEAFTPKSISSNQRGLIFDAGGTDAFDDWNVNEVSFTIVRSV